MVSLWYGVPLNELTNEQLHDVVAYLGRENRELRLDRDRWKRAGDPVKYLTDTVETNDTDRR